MRINVLSLTIGFVLNVLLLVLESKGVFVGLVNVDNYWT